MKIELDMVYIGQWLVYSKFSRWVIRGMMVPFVIVMHAILVLAAWHGSAEPSSYWEVVGFLSHIAWTVMSIFGGLALIIFNYAWMENDSYNARNWQEK